MLACSSLRVITILDCCYSGSLKICKGLGIEGKDGEDSVVSLANSVVEEKAEKLKQGVGRCLLAACQGYEEAYGRQEKDHSIFTYYLLEGLKGHKNVVDNKGNVTYDTLGKFIVRQIWNLPVDKHPKQMPVRKGEISGDEIILAQYPHLANYDENAEVLKNGNVMKRSIDFMNGVKKKMDICFDHTAPYFVTSQEYPYVKGYEMIKQRGAYIRAITEVTQDNLNYCKILKGMVDELSHLKGIKGGIAVSEDQYMTATSSLLQTDIASTEKTKIPMSEAVYSKRNEVVRHNQYIFDTLWENATTADII